MNPAKILVVEDERIIAMTLEHMLEELGYSVPGLTDRGEAAVEQAGSLRPDLVLMDIHLAGRMDGIETAQQIRERYRIPVVFLTAFAEDETLRRAQASLPYGYILKPCEARDLHATIQMALTRNHADLAIERSEARLQLALEAAELDVWEWDAESGRITTAGRSGIFGVMEAVSESYEAFLARVYADDRAAIEQSLQSAPASAGPISLVFRYVRPDGTVGWVEAHAKACRASSELPMTVVGVMKDITERWHIDERLRQAMVVFDSTAEAILILNSEHKIESVNPAFTAMTGYSLTEAIGRDPDVLLHARRHFDQFIPRIDAGGGHWQGETACRHRSGEVFTAWENVSVVSDAAGGITHYVVVISDISALRRAEAQLKHVALHDPLTGLPNRLLFNDRLDQELEAARRGKRRCAVLFIDLDGFKVINDTLGHASGDSLLQTVAVRLSETLRQNDTAARLGGDEFVIIPGDIEHAEDAARLARKLLDVLAAPTQLGEERIAVSASIGIAMYPEHGRDRHALVKAADTAMYSAKAQGRNRFRFYTDEMAGHAAERMGIEQGLRRALEASGLVLHYQPMVNLRDGRLSGIEALLRWRHPQQGLITPERFIAIAEESGLIEPLGRWVLDTACRELRDLVLRGESSLRLSVNVSVRQLAREDFEGVVRNVLEQSRFPSDRLELEITESTLQVLEDSRKSLGALKALGVDIAIDDFGTGFSSLSVIKHLPIDRLKIDRSFVRDIPGDANDVAIVETISTLSHTLGMSITAEGVETLSQLEFLRRLGCHEGQGYLFSHPLTIEQLRKLLASPTPWGRWFISSHGRPH